MASNLGRIEDISDQKVKIGQYKEKLADIIGRQDEQEIKAFVDHSKAVCLISGMTSGHLISVEFSCLCFGLVFSTNADA